MRPIDRTNPDPTSDQRSEGTALASECDSCRSLHLPARWHRCLGCGSRGLTPTRVELCGVFESWTLPQYVEAGGDRWALGLVRLDAGPMLTVRVKITDVPLCIGARVVGTSERLSGAPERFWFEVLPTAEAASRAFTEVAA
jgi:uncharacterized OB-fold protein